MSELNIYFRTLYFLSQPDISVPNEYVRRPEIVTVIQDKISEIAANYNASELFEIDVVSNLIFDELVSAKVIRIDQPKFAGSYYLFQKSRYAQFREEFASKDGISVTSQRIGARYFPDVIAGFRADVGAVPAADRIVTLDHNDPKLRKIQSDLSELETKLQQGNDIGNLDETSGKVALAEIAELRATLNQPQVRWDGLKARASGTLGWIGREAVGAVIGAMALAILALIAAFFGFGI